MSREDSGCDDSLYPIAVLIDELRNEDVQVRGSPINDVKLKKNNYRFILSSRGLRF